LTSQQWGESSADYTPHEAAFLVVDLAAVNASLRTEVKAVEEM